MLEKVLGKTREKIKACATIYKSVVQAVLLYGSEIWVVTDKIMILLEDFYHTIARQSEGMTGRWGYMEVWGCASVDASL